MCQKLKIVQHLFVPFPRCHEHFAVFGVKNKKNYHILFQEGRKLELLGRMINQAHNPIPPGGGQYDPPPRFFQNHSQTASAKTSKLCDF